MPKSLILCFRYVVHSLAVAPDFFKVLHFYVVKKYKSKIVLLIPCYEYRKLDHMNVRSLSHFVVNFIMEGLLM